MHDYKSRASYPSFGAKKRRRWPQWILAIVVLGGGGGAAYFAWLSFQTQGMATQPAAAPIPDANGRITIPLTLPVMDQKIEQVPQAKPDTTDNTDTSDMPFWHTLTITKGDSLAALLKRMAVDLDSLYAILALAPAKTKLNQLHPGDTVELQVDDQQQITALRTALDPLKTLVVKREPKGYQAQVEARETDLQISYATATIENSLFADGKKAGLSEPMLLNLLSLFGWDIDFALDLQRGDHFTIIYEAHYDELGEKIADGDILAAEFNNRGVAHRVVRYTNRLGHTDYYDLDGRPMHKTFLRTPVNFTYISSHFNPRRLHPILNTIRAHKGVDYAAPTGTPIYATADGVVEFKGTKGGYGKAVVLQHGDHYSTLYGHLSAFAPNLGEQVSQGQLIGFVGQTGSATGPHLHYEFRVDGIHQDPLTVKLPHSEPLADAERADFLRVTSPLALRIRLLSNSTVALVAAHYRQ